MCRSFVVFAWVLLGLVLCSFAFVGASFCSFVAIELSRHLSVLMVRGFLGTLLLVHYSFYRRLLFSGSSSRQVPALFQFFILVQP